MSFLKKIFSKKEGRKPKHEKDKDIQEWIQHFKSVGKKNQIEYYEKFLTEINQIDSAKARAIHKFMEAGLEHSKEARALKIVNEYGRALQDATQQNKSITDENLNADSLKSFREKGAIYYRYLGYLDISFLPYSKEIIREAIEFLLQHSQDETDPRIEQLRGGLLLLDNFIDFSHIEP